jgi:hypothetical protein
MQLVIEMRILNSGTYSINVSGLGEILTTFTTSSAEAWSPFDGLALGQPLPVNANTLIAPAIGIRGSAQIDIRRFGFRKVNSVVPPFI